MPIHVSSGPLVRVGGRRGVSVVGPASSPEPPPPAPDANIMAALPIAYFDAGDVTNQYSDLGTTLITGSGDLVKQANDKSGHGCNASCPTDATRFEYLSSQQNGRGAWRVDPAARGGSGKFLDFSVNGLSGTGWHSFFVSKQPTAPSGWLGQISLTNRSGGDTHFPYSDGTIYDGTAANTRFTVGPLGASWNAVHIYEVEVSATAWTCRCDGVQIYTAAGDFRSHPTIACRMGGNGSGSQFGDMYIYMLVCFNYPLGAGRTAVYDDIATIWGL